MKGKKPTLKKLDLLIRNVELKMLPKSVSTVLNSPHGDGVSVRGAGRLVQSPPLPTPSDRGHRLVSVPPGAGGWGAGGVTRGSRGSLS